MEKYTFQKIKQNIYEWGQNDILKYLSQSDELELSKNSDDILIFDFTFHHCLAQLTVSNPLFAPYQYVDFEAIAGESEKPELVYFFYDSKDMTEEDVFHELEVGIQYCSGYIPDQLRKKYLNKRGTITIEHEKLHYVVHPDDLGKVNIESISGEFVCIDVEAQYLVVMRDSFVIRIIEKVFSLRSC